MTTRGRLLSVLVSGLLLTCCAPATADVLPVTADLVLWLDAGDLDGDGTAEGLAEDGQTAGVVSVWKDKSVNGNDVTDAADAARAPILDLAGSLNGLPVVDFSSDAYLSRADAMGLAGNPALTVFIVTRDNDGAVSDHRLFQIGTDDGSGSGGLVTALSNDSSWRYNNGNHVFANDKLDSTTEGLIGIWRTDAGQNYGATEFFKNSSTPAVATGTGNETNVVNMPDEATIIGGGYYTAGSLSNPTNNSNADIAELLVYSSELGADDLEAVGYYLQEKWAVNSTFVPEPSSAILLAAALIPALVRRRRGAA